MEFLYIELNLLCMMCYICGKMNDKKFSSPELPMKCYLEQTSWKWHEKKTEQNINLQTIIADKGL
jgi:hypothetical protein